MAHIYGHSWPVRWGAAGEKKMVKVYSNAGEAELFSNGESAGTRRRNSADFPAAGLRWTVVFQPGENVLRVVARRGKEMVADTIRFLYQTEKWGRPVRLEIGEVGGAGAAESDTVTVRVRLVDANGVPCLDAANWVRWGLAGEGQLLDDLGTSTGSRYVQAFNGTSMIRVWRHGGHSVVSALVDGLPVVFLHL